MTPQEREDASHVAKFILSFGTDRALELIGRLALLAMDDLGDDALQLIERIDDDSRHGWKERTGP